MIDCWRAWRFRDKLFGRENKLLIEPLGLIVAIILLLFPYTFQQAFTQEVPEI